jgi:hypothetical protein
MTGHAAAGGIGGQDAVIFRDPVQGIADKTIFAVRGKEFHFPRLGGIFDKISVSVRGGIHDRPKELHQSLRPPRSCGNNICCPVQIIWRKSGTEA